MKIILGLLLISTFYSCGVNTQAGSKQTDSKYDGNYYNKSNVYDKVELLFDPRKANDGDTLILIKATQATQGGNGDACIIQKLRK